MPKRSNGSVRLIGRIWVLGLLTLFFAIPSLAQTPLPEHSLYIMNADGTNRRPLVGSEEFAAHGSPCFSPDGKKLAFDAWRAKQGESASKAHIVLTKADGTSLKDLGDGAMPSWSPDGKHIIYTRYSPNRGVWIMNADGSGKTLIDGRGWCGQCSPDGKKIAYTKYHQNGANLCIYDRKTKAQKFLFEWDEDSEPYRQIQWNFCWSPDSNQICFKALRSDQTWEIAIVSADGVSHGFHPCFTLEKPAAEDLAWHPGEKTILASMTNSQQKNIRQLFTFEPKTDTIPKPVPNQSPEWANLNGAWTPDGKQIVFSSRKLEKK